MFKTKDRRIFEQEIFKSLPDFQSRSWSGGIDSTRVGKYQIRVDYYGSNAITLFVKIEKNKHLQDDIFV